MAWCHVWPCLRETLLLLCNVQLEAELDREVQERERCEGVIRELEQMIAELRKASGRGATAMAGPHARLPACKCPCISLAPLIITSFPHCSRRRRCTSCKSSSR